MALNKGVAVAKLTNLQRLRAAGVADAKSYSQAEQAIINRMTDQEVRFLIRMRKKYGSRLKRGSYRRAAFPV